jgi:hypothetical protein
MIGGAEQTARRRLEEVVEVEEVDGGGKHVRLKKRSMILRTNEARAAHDLCCRLLLEY